MYAVVAFRVLVSYLFLITDIRRNDIADLISFYNHAFDENVLS